MEIQLLISTIVSLFVVVDPVGTSAVFAVLTRGMDRTEQQHTALRAVIVSVILLVFFGLTGRPLLDYMHVSLPAFRVAGGILLFVTAFRMIMGFHDPDQLNSERSAYKNVSDIAIFPLAIPLLAGPGVITATLMFMTEAATITQHISVLFSIIVVQSIALAALLSAGKLARFFGSTAQGVIARVMGILLAALAVQFVTDGLKMIIAKGT